MLKRLICFCARLWNSKTLKAKTFVIYCEIF